MFFQEVLGESESDDPGVTDPCEGCRIQMDPTIHGAEFLGGVKDPHGSDDPGDRDTCERPRIHMDATIQRSQIPVRGAGSRWIQRSMGQNSWEG